MLVMEAMIKGKRTKRPRASPVSQPRLSLTLSSGENDGVSILATSSSSTSGCTTNNNSNHFDHEVVVSSTEEEEDMANCLILLAQGRFDHDDDDDEHDDRRQGLAVRNDVVYQCKTCDRVFASFQALGGHRASHKKTSNNNSKANVEGGHTNKFKLVKTTTMSFCGDGQEGFVVNPSASSDTSTALSLQISTRSILGVNNKGNGNKVHECSICGAEFASGQALGGHMRRHRTTSMSSSSFMHQTMTTTSFTSSVASTTRELSKSKKPRNSALELDLNLPASSEAEDHDAGREKMKFPFVGPAGTEQVIVFSASPLVDCYY